MDDAMVMGAGTGGAPLAGSAEVGGGSIGRPGAGGVSGVDATSGGDAAAPSEVTVAGVPARLFLESQDHQHDLIREFALIHLGRRPDDTATEAEYLARLIADVHHRYADVRWLTRQQALDAIENGEDELAMKLPVRPGMAAALRHWLDLLDRADRFCEQGALLTLAATPEVRRLRRWYAEEVIRVLPAEPVEAPRRA